jgi:ABC-type antimicrobial peptide transport system permease subunit
MFSLFGGLALLLAAFGIYVSIYFNLLQRKHEMGIRLALGAPWKDLLHLGWRGSVRFVLTGTVIGFICIFLLGDLIQPLLLGVTALDPVILLGAALVLVGAAALAGYLPIRRFQRVDPVEILRPE